MRATGGTDSARYCYSVWLRHLILRNEAGLDGGIPESVAELGPGDSIGIGLAALLAGTEKYYALDVVAYSDLKSNLTIFDELVQLYRDREPIPGDDEFPSMNPKLRSYEFPQNLLTEPLLRITLDPARIDDIRSSIEHADDGRSRIFYRAPWDDEAVIERNSIDLFFSQAVLEHVNNLADVYKSMRRWLKPNGVMSHQIDYRCHGKADTWNGHWTYSDAVWKLIVGRRPYLLNRAPHSEHVRLLKEAGFEILKQNLVRSVSALQQKHLAPRFHSLNDEDLTTSGAFIVAAAAKLAS
jgi:SAM-dependent methyltransferase